MKFFGASRLWKEHKRKIQGEKWAHMLLAAVLCAILARGEVLKGFAPFGVSFFAAAFTGGISYALIPISCLTQLISGISFLSVVQYAVAMLFFALCMMHFSEEKDRNPVQIGSLAGGCNLVAGILIALGGAPLLYDILRLVLESFLCALAAIAFQTAKAPVTDFKERRTLSFHESVCLAGAAGLILLGVGDAATVGAFHIERALGVLVVMLFAYKYGEAAAGMGIAVGFFVGMAGYMMAETMASYGFCALIAGMLSRYKKWGVTLGFILSNAVLTIIFNGSREVIIHLYEIVAAAAVFGILPHRFLAKYGGFSVSEREEHRDWMMRRYAAEQMEALSRNFRQIEQSVHSLSMRQGMRPVEEALLFERTLNSVCHDCSMRRCCWQIDGKESYQALDEMLRWMQKHDGIEKENLPNKFQDDCVRQSELCRTFEEKYELYQVDRLWRSRVEESRHLMATQIARMTDAVEDLAEDLRNTEGWDEHRTALLSRAFAKQQIQASDVRVWQDEEGWYGVRLSVPPCGGFGQCKNRILPVVEGVLGVRMERLGTCACGGCRLEFAQAREMHVDVAASVRRAGGSKASGDSYEWLHLPGGRFATFLCDGMGTGMRAAQESKNAVNLMRSLLESGTEKCLAAAFLNSVLVSASIENRLTSLDLCMIDLSGGATEILKLGAAGSYILRGEQVEIIESQTLPAGSGEGADMEIFKTHLEDGNRLVLLSDGVTEGKEPDWLRNVLLTLGHLPDKELADGILAAAGKNNRDDMTCVVITLSSNQTQSEKKRLSLPG